MLAAMSWLISDPYFYAVAVPAVLLMGISKSGFGGGFGSLCVPLMAIAVGVPRAAAIFMPVLLLCDLLGLAAYRREFDRSLLRLLLPWSLAGLLAGALLFKVTPAQVAAGVVGGLTLLFLLQRLMFPPRPDAPPPPRWLGRVMAVLSGFTSFVAHAGGPPINVYMIPQRLPPVTFTATLAVMFFVLNLSKWLPYAWLGLIDTRNMVTSLVLLPLVPVGVWVGVRVARRIAPHWFYRLLYLGMLLTGSKLLWDAFA